jgi:hypothetical protein
MGVVIAAADHDQKAAGARFAVGPIEAQDRADCRLRALDIQQNGPSRNEHKVGKTDRQSPWFTASMPVQLGRFT